MDVLSVSKLEKKKYFKCKTTDSVLKLYVTIAFGKMLLSSNLEGVALP